MMPNTLPNKLPFGGRLPTAFGNLLEPTVIDMQYNFLTGPLPESFSKLQTLKEL